MLFESEHGATTPPSSSPLSASNPKKRAGEDENALSISRSKKRLFGRTLGSELQEIELNTVSNTTIEDRTSPVPQLPESVNQNSPSLLTPPAETSSNLTESIEESVHYKYTLSTSGKRIYLPNRKQLERLSYEQLIAQRSETAEAGKPQKDYYGVNIHELIAEAQKAAALPKPQPVEPLPVVQSVEGRKNRKRAGLMWTEKYRAKKFTDLCGDERTHRQVLRWLKSWDPVVFPRAAKQKPTFKNGRFDQEESHRKILLLTGPPGLGKTTLAHVCAKQAGYECVEVNASDDRTSSVVKNKIKDCLGTENVRGVNVLQEGSKGTRQPGKPVCVILDEVDGVAGNTSSGDGGFMKALVDLVLLDQKNSKNPGGFSGGGKSRKGDQFRMLRPLILVCNDVYASSLRPLRHSGLAEIIHIRKPPLDRVIERVKFIFEREGVPCDDDAVRKLCEHTWGISNRRESKTGRSSADGDMRSVLVAAEWAVTKLRSTSSVGSPRLTKQWIDVNIVSGSFDNGNRGLGRGGAREAADRVFMENAGFGKKSRGDSTASSGFIVPGAPRTITDAGRYEPMRMLRECVDTIDEHDRIITEVFSSYPTYNFQDDTILTKPNAAYEWLDFHDRISTKVFSGQEWELKPYQSSPSLGFHYLFGNGAKQQIKLAADEVQDDDQSEQLPFFGPRASYDAHEFHKETRATLSNLQACEGFNINLKRMFHRPEDMATDLMPQLIRILTPEVKPVIIGGKGEQMASVRRESERDMIRRSVGAMAAVGVAFEKFRIDDPRAGNGGFIYRMEPALDTVSTYESLGKAGSSTSTARYAVRQIMQQEHHKFMAQQNAEARQARLRSSVKDSSSAIATADDESASSTGPTVIIPADDSAKVKRDFFGRIIKTSSAPTSRARQSSSSAANAMGSGKVKIWATFNEGFSNAVRKPISLKELLDGL